VARTYTTTTIDDLDAYSTGMKLSVLFIPMIDKPLLVLF